MADLDPTTRQSTTQPRRPRGQGRIFTRKGSPFWWCAYFLRGQEFRESTGTADERQAGQFLKRRIKEVGADHIGAKSFVSPQQQRTTINEMLHALEKDYELRGKDNPQFRSHLAHIREHFGLQRAIELTAEMVDAYIEQRLESGAAKATINRSTQLLSQGYKLAIERRRLSMAPHIRHLTERGNARQGFFADYEVRSVLANLPSYLKDFALFAYLTGWRRGEIASLRWEDVDGDVIRLRGENSKNGDARSITLDGELAELMKRRKSARQAKTDSTVMLADLVFHHQGQPIVDFRKSWATACKMAGVPGKLFHDFRRTAVRNMVRAGVPERVAMSISGHKTRSIFDRYNIVSERDLRDAMQRTQTYLIATAAEEAKRKPAEMRRVQ